MKSSIRFYFYYSWVEFKEQFSNLANGLSGFLLFPLFMFVLAKLSIHFNGYQKNFSFGELAAYIGFTEVLFMTFLRSVYFARTTGDFSMSLSRPRRWWLMTFFGSFSRTFGNRLVFLAILALLMPLFGVTALETSQSVLRFLILLPLLTIGQAILFFLFACAQIRWDQTRFLVLPVSKIFLVFGGVFGPLADYTEPARSMILMFLPSDLFFQPAFFAVKGSFYLMTASIWFMRLIAWYIALIVIGVFFYKNARKHHQSYGG